MHRWDSRLRPPPAGIRPTRWSDATGSPTRGQLRGPAWRRSSHGLYVPSGAPLTPSQRVLEAAALLPGFGAVSGWASAYWQGARLLDGLGAGGVDPQPVLLLVGAEGKIRRRDGIEVSRERLDPDDVVVVRDVPCATALRTAFDGARLAASLVEAVVHIDLMLTCGLMELDAVRRYVAQRVGWRGVQRARTAVSLAVPGSKSPPETRMRLVWVLDAQLPTPLVNQPVFDLDGRLLGLPDCLDAESGTVMEYDSDDHRDLVNHTADNAREEIFEDHGLSVHRVTRLDLRRDRRAALVERMQRARARGLRRDRSADRWTLTPPPGWRPFP